MRGFSFCVVGQIRGCVCRRLCRRLCLFTYTDCIKGLCFFVCVCCTRRVCGAYMWVPVHVVSLVCHFSKVSLRKLTTECATATEGVRETERKTRGREAEGERRREC